MTAKPIVLALLAVAVPSLALAQGKAETERERGNRECNRDVSRFCKGEIQQGENLVLGCLKQNASKISRPCRKVLEDNGQL